MDETVFQAGPPGDPLLIDLQHMLRVDPLAPHTGPPYFELPLSAIPELEGTRRLRVEVEAAPGLRLWAFVTAIHNTTQHLTALSPQGTLSRHGRAVRR